MTRTMTLTIIFAATGFLTSCGPTLSTQTRIEIVRAPSNTGTITKDGLAIEIPDPTHWSRQFMINVPSCNVYGQPETDVTGPVTKDVMIVPESTSVYQLKITNQTDHIIRLQGAVIRLFDPADNQIEPQEKADIAATASRWLGSEGVCSSAVSKVQDALQSLKVIGVNTELFPGTTTSGFLFFAPPKQGIPGVWKLSMYEVPVQVNEAGMPIVKARFDFGYVVKKYTDTIKTEFMGKPEVVDTKEVR